MNHLYRLLLLLTGTFTFGLHAQIPTLNNPSACGLNLALGDATCPENSFFSAPDSFYIQVNAAPGGTLGQDVVLREVRLIVEHSWVSDLTINLTSPAGQTALLISDTGGNGDNLGLGGDPSCGTPMRFGLAACVPVNHDQAPFLEGPYRAVSDLYVLNDGVTDPTAGPWLLSICDDLADDVGRLQYVELVFEPLTCLPLQSAEVLSVDSTTARFSYTPGSLCGPVVAEIGPPGFTPGADSFPGQGQVFYVDCPPFTLGNLPEDMTFELYLRRICDGGTTFSGNSCPVLFRTGCRPLPPTAVTTFDQEATCVTYCSTDCPLTGAWRNVAGDDFDWLTNGGSTPTLIGTGPNDDITGGGHYVYLEANGSQCPAGGEAYLLSGCFELDKQGSDSCHLSFAYHMYGINMGKLSLEASNDGGMSWNRLWQRNGNQGNRWYRAYVSLADYADGEVLQFRFVGEKGLGIFGDMAIDQIVLHGSQYLGYSEQPLYADVDGDGYGAPPALGFTCEDNPPFGFSFSGDDCNDNDPGINPEAAEIPCNGVDENCNSPEVDDDPLLPSPAVTSDTICSGDSPTLTATTDPGYSIFWWDTPDKQNLLWVGDAYSPALPPNNSPFPETYTFYAEATDLSCSSELLAPATVVVRPRPLGSIADQPTICPGSSLDLRSVPILDEHFTGASVTFHTSSPATAANELAGSVVNPAVTTNYIYLLTSPAGCTFEGTLTVVLRVAPSIAFSPADSFSVCRLARDTIVADVTGGAGGYTYLWENGIAGPQLPVWGSNSPGSQDVYSLTVTDAAACTSVDSAKITTTISIDSLVVLTNPVSTCEGSDGAIEIVPLNGQPPFSYSWQDATGNSGSGDGILDTIRLENLSQNAYRITILDNSAEGCEVSLRNIRVQGPGFQLSETSISEPSCAGGADGGICLDVSGSGGLTYTWSDGQTAECAENLTAGTYSVTISNGECTTVETYTLAEPLPLVVAADLLAPSCAESEDGAILAQVFGGTGGYDFAWSEGGQSADIEGLSDGDYVLAVTDEQGCARVDTFSLEAPPPLELTIDSVRSVSCFGEMDGLALLGAAGGTPPYHYQWADGNQTALRANIPAGVYSATVTDFNGCAASGTVTVGSPAVLAASFSVLTRPICRGDSTGSVQMVANGGTLPYTFQWNDGFTTENAVRTGLPVGQYQVVVIDAKGCKTTGINVNLNPESDLQLNFSQSSPTCVGTEDGSLSVNATGSAPFTYAWEEDNPRFDLPDPSQSVLSNIAGGRYKVTVTDDRGCIAEDSTTVTAPQVFNIISTLTQPSCFGVNDGIIDQTFVSQGNGGLQFFWSDDSQHTDRFNMPPGDYHYTVTDIEGCQFYSDTFSLAYPPQLSLELIDSGGIACAGDTTGYFETTAEGGTPPYQYNWIGKGVSVSNIYGLSAGSHLLSVTDGRGCPLDTSLQLADPTPLLVTASLEPGDLCDVNDPDRLQVTASGGTPPFEYLWSDSTTSAVIENPLPGNYTVSVTDANGCTNVDGTIKVQNRIPPLELDTFYVSPVSCFGGSDAYMTALTLGGSGLLEYHFTPTKLDTTAADSVTIAGLPHAQSYSVTVTDLVSGCQVASSVIQVPQPMPITIMRDSFQTVNCFGVADGAVYVSVNGGTGSYAYSWQDSLGLEVGTQQDLEQVQAGTYQLLVTDTNGCTAQFMDSSVVAVHPPIALEGLVAEPATCQGEATGALDVSIDGGVPPYTFVWSNQATTEDVMGLAAGSYSLTVTDSDTCRAIFTDLEVDEPTTALSIVATVDSISCFGLTDGQIELEVTGGGGPPYQYAWRRNGLIWPSQVGATVTNLPPNTYQAIVRDTNGCVRTQTFFLTSPPELTVEIINDPLGVDSLQAVVLGGSPPYQYSWSTGAMTPTIRMLNSGNYSLTVTDGRDCDFTTSYVLTKTTPESEKSAYRLFPNPAREQIQLQVSAAVRNERVEWVLSDMRGRLLQSGAWPRGSNSLIISLENIPAGAYLLQLRPGAERPLSWRVIRLE